MLKVEHNRRTFILPSPPLALTSKLSYEAENYLCVDLYFGFKMQYRIRFLSCINIKIVPRMYSLSTTSF